MRKTFLFSAVLLLTAAWLIGCGTSSKTVVPTPSLTSNFAFIQSGLSSSAALVRPHFDLRGTRGAHQVAHKQVSRHGLKPLMDNAPGTDSVIVMKNDGTGRTVVANQAGWFYAVQLSLDGKKGVGVAEDMNGYAQVFYVDLANLSNLNPVQLTTDMENHYYAQLSPDGSKVLFMKEANGMPQAFTVKVSGGAETMITVPTGISVNFPTYTPDGTKIVFEEEENDTIDIMNADGTGLTVLTNQGGVYYDEYPSVSADGKTIMFSRYPGDENGGENIFAVNIDGSNLRQITTDGSSWDPLFVNDKVVFVSYRDGGNGQIYAMGPDGSGQVRLTNDNADNYFVW